MTSCQEYLLKIKLGEMNSIWRAHIWKAKGRDAETVEFWPEYRKPCSAPVHLHATSWWSIKPVRTMTWLPLRFVSKLTWLLYNKSLRDQTCWSLNKALTMTGTIFVFSITRFICKRKSLAVWDVNLFTFLPRVDRYRSHVCTLNMKQEPAA